VFCACVDLVVSAGVGTAVPAAAIQPKSSPPLPSIAYIVNVMEVISDPAAAACISPSIRVYLP
jgi:hypothetical protein